jgi:hypothetical protein
MIKPTPLRTLKIALFCDLCRLFRLPVTCSLRFIPKEQKRLDNRGRTIATYESAKDALADLRAIYDGTLATKEPEHGTYYLAAEIRSSHVEKLGAGRRNRYPITLPLPLSVPQGVPGEAAGQSHASDAAKAAHDEAEGAVAGRGVHEQGAGSEAPASADQSVGKVKVDLSKIGVR